jgi:transcription elongation factor Elf1
VRPQQTAWATEEPCPSCDAEMVLLDDGLLITLAECRACGHREIWDGESRGAIGGDDW